jgi:hypothetical protein
MLTEAELVCGTKRISCNNKKNTKATQWWMEEIREMVKDKKEAWKHYIKNKNEVSWEMYVEKRTLVKKTVKETKKPQWECFGEEIENNFTEKKRQFWKKIKSLRGKYDKKYYKIRDENNIIKKWKKRK